MGERLSDVFIANRERLRAFLRARCADEAVDDLLQELWLKAAAILGPIEPSPLSYLFRMADRLVVDRHRGAHRRLRREEDWGSAFLQADAYEPSCEDRLIVRENLQAALAALDALGPRVGHVFRRYRLEGAQQRDIATELGVSLRTVEKDLRKAYNVLVAMRMDSDAV